jgi:dihydroorotate dehydrogenase electron transfer subunit
MANGDRDGGAGGVAPVQVRGTVLTVRRVDAYVAMTVVAPAIATRFRPGQFIAIAVGGPQSGMLGRRAFSVHDVRPDHGGTVEFVFLPREPGAQWLAECRARDVLDVVGPLGRPFPVPRDPASCLLLGVGAGAAPLFALASRLAERGSEPDFLLGAESADRVFGALTARRTGRSAVIATADGSLGARGSVVDMLPTAVQQARTDVIYAAAPLPVLRSVCALAARYGIPVQALVAEPVMMCGTGLCMGCVLPAVGTDGGPGVPRRSGALGRRGDDTVRRARRPRLEAAARRRGRVRCGRLGGWAVQCQLTGSRAGGPRAGSRVGRTQGR